MINILEIDEYEEIYSYSGRIEILVFYDRVKSLVDFYNFTMKNYFDYLNSKELEFENLKNIAKYDYSEYELLSQMYDDKIYSMRVNYLDYQKITLIVILYSEVEKLIDNLNNLLARKNTEINLKYKIESLAKNYNINNSDIFCIKDSINKLRIIRNKVIHSYDYWDDKVTIDGVKYIGLENIDDNCLEKIIREIILSIKMIEVKYL